jgi:hypothetical protein
MPISYGSFEKQMKLLPIVMHADGRVTVTVRIGYMEGGNLKAATEQTYVLDASVVSGLLDVPSIQGMTRRDDLAYAIYAHLVNSGAIERGEIT